MKFTIKKTLGVTAILFSLITSQVYATPITFSGSSGDLAASVTFDVSGTDLLVTLTNTSTADPSVPADILTGVIFSITGNPFLTKTSATLHSGSSVIHGPSPSTDPGAVVGGEWAYTNDLSSTGFAGQSAIYSSGYFDGNARFPGNNLDGPGSVDGLQYGITTLYDLSGNDNGGIDNGGLIQNSVDFVLSGLPGGFELSSISDVSFQYGTDLSEPNIPSDGGGGGGGTPVPEPGTLILVGVGLAGLAMYRRKM